MTPMLMAMKAHRDDAERALEVGCLSLEQFVLLQQAWSGDAFGPSPPRGPVGPLKHLAKEVPEALEAWAEVERRQALCAAAPDDRVAADYLEHARQRFLTELVDCQFLIFDAVWRAAFGSTELRQALGKKLQINRQRSWPKMAPDQAVEHDRSGDDAAATEHR